MLIITFSAGKEVIAQSKEKIDQLRDMNSARNNNEYNGHMVYSQANQNEIEKTDLVNNNNEHQEQQKSLLDDDFDEILAKMDV